jgi:hypothetical protein
MPRRPAGLGGEASKEAGLVTAFRRLPDQFIEPMRVLADQDTPPVRSVAIEDDGGRFLRARRRVI